jgi:hypothetical protein
MISETTINIYADRVPGVMKLGYDAIGLMALGSKGSQGAPPHVFPLTGNV